MSIADVLTGRKSWHVETTDVRAGLARIPDKSIQTICTSPPYFGLRAYNTTPQVWGGDDHCEHIWSDDLKPGNYNWQDTIQATGNLDNGQQKIAAAQRSRVCVRCTAWLGELGSEPTPAQFIENMRLIFRELWRVLRDDGTAWINIADSYCGSNKGTPGPNAKIAHTERQGFVGGGKDAGVKAPRKRTGQIPTGMRAKSLALIPERLAIMLQEEGWVIRSRIAWVKLSCLPESVVDRPTAAWEHLWLITKNAKYYYDAESVRQPYNEDSIGRYQYAMQGTAPTSHQPGGDDERREREKGVHPPNELGANLRNVWLLPPEPNSDAWCTACQTLWQGVDLRRIKTKMRTNPEGGEKTPVRICPCGGENTILGHFATYPTEIVRRAVLAGTSLKGACPECGTAWRRVTGHLCPHCGAIRRANSKPCCEEGGNWADDRVSHDEWLTDAHTTGKAPRKSVAMGASTQKELKWEPGCKCGISETVPCLVCDPFSGSGTTVLVAYQLGRRAIGLELNPQYAAASRARIGNDAPLFAGLF